VLLMDEPFGAVDPITRSSLQDELLRLQTELGKTIVFVTHDFGEAVMLGDRSAVLGQKSPWPPELSRQTETISV
jgi:osmoprotectant transport system ATP-binding protein